MYGSGTFVTQTYGAGDAKIGSIVGSGATTGRRIKNNFMQAVPAYKKVVQKLHRMSERQGWIPALDGGHLSVRSPHKALNTSLQSAGALVAKHWMMEIESIMTEEHGWEHGWEGNFTQLAMIHDEAQFAVYVPECEYNLYVDNYDYSTVVGKDAKDTQKLIAKLKAKRKLDWYINTFPQMKLLADATKTAVKRTEQHFNFVCPLDCEYIVGRNWAECH